MTRKSGRINHEGPRRSVYRLLAGCIACASLSAFDSLAQSYPVKPIRLVVNSAPGSGVDLATRAFAPHLGEAVTASPDEFAARQRRERERFGVFIREANIRAE